MVPRNKILIFSLSFLLLCHAWQAIEAGAQEAASSIIFEVGDKRLTMEVDKVPLGDVLDEMRREYFSDISGLDHRRGELITLMASGNTVEDILKRLLKHLGENNYAFEFADENLKKVSVLPEAKTETASAGAQETSNNTPDYFESVAEVHSIIEGSQADIVGLAVGDIIIKYDGIRVDSSMGLIREVSRKSDLAQVEMIVVRQGTILPFILKGGLIGVRISTKKIPSQEFERYN